MKNRSTSHLSVPSSDGEQADETLPASVKHKVSFSGHETFTLRYGWLKKAVDAVLTDSHVFQDEAAMVSLGVGKNMVRSIRHWGLATGVLAEHSSGGGQGVRVSAFGMQIFGPSGMDPYLEDLNTLWLLHWNLCRPAARCTTWQWAFGNLPSNDFTRDTLLDFLRSQIRQQQVTVPSEAILKRDIDVFIRTYLAAPSKKSVVEDSVDSPLAELALIQDRGHGKSFGLLRGPRPSLSDHVFQYALTEFWDAVARDRSSLPLSDIAYRAGSPGMVFKVDEKSILERLERLGSRPAAEFEFSETAGLRQLYRRGDKPATLSLDLHYKNPDASA